MSAETDYLRSELNSVKAQLRNQTLRIKACDAIDKAIGLLDGRDAYEAAGKDMGEIDAALLTAVIADITTKVAAVTSEVIDVPTVADISAGLDAL